MRWVENLNHEIQQDKKSPAEQEKEHRQLQEYLSQPGKTILAVDQLWIRVLDDDTIVSSCTNPSDASEASLPEQIRRFITLNEEKDEFERPRTTEAMIELVLSITTTMFLEQRFSQKPRKGNSEPCESKNALEIFQESVRSLMDKEAILYRSFLTSLENESHSHKHMGFVRNIPKNPYHVIDDEAYLLREIKDIRDELNMLKAVFEGQKQVWQHTFKTEDLETFPGYQYNHPTNPSRLLDEIARIAEEASAVQDSINALLELRQQQAGIKEAEFGRWQANDTAKQANITLVFTIVAILFLPLSFLTSLFALNVTEFPHSGDGVEFQGKWIFPIIFCTSACVSVPFLIFAFNVNQVVDGWNAWIPSRGQRQSAGSPKQPPMDRTEEAEGGSSPIYPSRSSNFLARNLGARRLGLMHQHKGRLDSNRGYGREPEMGASRREDV